MTENTKWHPVPNTWTYQFVDCGGYITIAEVYYNKDAQPAAFCNRSIEEYLDEMSTAQDVQEALLEKLKRMARAAEKPMLNSEHDFCGFGTDDDSE